MHGSHVRAERTITELSLIFSLEIQGCCAFARCRHTLARWIIALADQSSLYRGFTR